MHVVVPAVTPAAFRYVPAAHCVHALVRPPPYPILHTKSYALTEPITVDAELAVHAVHTDKPRVDEYVDTPHDTHVVNPTVP